MRLKTLFIFLILPIFLFSKEPPVVENQNPLVNYEGLPSSVVAGCVNTITGDYFENSVDLFLPLPEPFVIQRFYTSSDCYQESFEKGSLMYGWNLNHMGEVKLSKNAIKNPGIATCSVKGDCGVVTSYNRDKTSGIGIGHLMLSSNMISSGVTNSGRGEISGRTNPKNTIVTYSTDYCDVRDGSGTVRLYHKTKNRNFQLAQEKKPSGISYFYDYDQEERLQRISVKNRSDQEIAFVEFGRPADRDFKNNPRLFLYSCDNRQIKYNFKKKNKLVLYEAQRTEGAADLYAYESVPESEFSRITQRAQPDGRYRSIEYYKTNRFEDFQKNRVKALYAPVGTDNTSILTHKFVYRKKETSVFDAYNQHTDYQYDDHKRLTTITKFLNGNPRSVERFTWGADDTTDAGNLITRLVDQEGKILFCRRYFYDHLGNVLKDRIYGNLSGTNHVGIGLDSNGHPCDNGCETYEVNYTYSNDGLNLVTSKDTGRCIIRYGYHPGTDLKAYEFLYEGAQIRKRHFFEYDANGAITQEIEDNGSANAKDDLTSVSQRLVTDIQTSNTIPFGLPVVLVKSYLKEGSLHQISRIVNHYRPDGLILVQEHYDADNQHLYNLCWDYDQYGHVISETDALGQVIERNYDPNGNLIHEQGPSYQKDYTYDYSNRMTKVVETSSNGVQHTFQHHYNFLNQRIATEDNYGNRTNFEYDRAGYQTKVILPDGTHTNTTYDVLGNPLVFVDSLNHATKREFTTWGKPFVVTFPDGSQERNEYTLDGLLKKHTDRNGLITIYDYDYQGRPTVKECFINGELLTRTQKVYDAFHLIQEIDALGISTQYQYDSAGRLIAEKTEDAEVCYAYDSQNRISKKCIKTTDDEGIITTWQYDILGRIISETTTNRITEYAYDFLGNCTDVTINGSTTHTDYDFWKRPIRKIDALGQQILYNYYEQKALRIEIIDPKGNKTNLAHNALGRLVTKSNQNIYNELLSKEEYIYDTNGNRTYIIQTVITPEAKPRQITAHLEYNWEGKVTTIVEAEKTQEQKTTRYCYNNFGQKIEVTKPDGVTIKYTYDPFGRLNEFSSSDNTVQYTYEYDLNGNPIKIENQIHNTLTERQYDNNRLISETLENRLTINYVYDNAGQVTSLILPDQTSIGYDYQGDQIAHISRYDQDHVLKYTHTYNTYDSAGHVTESTLIGNAGTLSFEYDVLQRVNKISSPSFQCQAAYDVIGNLTTCDVTDDLGSFSQRYTYDDLNQLTQEIGAVEHQFVNDSINNIVKRDQNARPHNDLNQLLLEGQQDYQYDLNGNLTAIANTKLTYDALDRLIKVQTPDKTIEYRYDAFNRRTSKDDEYYLYVQQKEIGAWKNNTFENLRILGVGHGAEIGASVAIELNGVPYAPIHDLSGHVVALIDSQGRIAATYRYSAYGEELTDTSLQNPWRFASKRLDSETGFINFGRRYYSPIMAKWITPDPIGFEDGPNLYAYVHNNPLIHFDEYGLWNAESTPDDRNRTNLSTRNENKNFWNKTKTNLNEFKIGAKDQIHEESFGVVGELSEENPGGFFYWSGRTVVFGAACLMPTSWLTKGLKAPKIIGSIFKYGYELLESSGITSLCGKVTRLAGTGSNVRQTACKTADNIFFKEGAATTVSREGITVCERYGLDSGHMWIEGSPFRHKTAAEIAAELEKVGYRTEGNFPLIGKGSFFKDTPRRQLRIDPIEYGRYREPSHVDIINYDKHGNMFKKRYKYLDE